MEENRRIRGFREVVDLISCSKKPIVSQNFLSDFTCIHSKFLGPLPSNVDEFSSSLSSAFPSVVDLSQLMKEVSPLSNLNNLPAALSSLNRFFAPVDVQVANQGCSVELDEHGQNAVMISQLFAKLSTIKKSDESSALSSNDENVKVWSKNSRRVSSENLVFIWGYEKKMTAAMLKNILQKSHSVFAQEFDVKYVDKSCAVVVFWESGLSETFLSALNNEEEVGGGSLNGLRAAGYEVYKKACRLGLWEADLADSLDKALDSSDTEPDSDSDSKPSEIDWTNELALNFDQL